MRRTITLTWMDDGIGNVKTRLNFTCTQGGKRFRLYGSIHNGNTIDIYTKIMAGVSDEPRYVKFCEQLEKGKETRR